MPSSRSSANRGSGRSGRLPISVYDAIDQSVASGPTLPLRQARGSTLPLRQARPTYGAVEGVHRSSAEASSEEGGSGSGNSGAGSGGAASGKGSGGGCSKLTIALLAGAALLGGGGYWWSQQGESNGNAVTDPKNLPYKGHAEEEPIAEDTVRDRSAPKSLAQIRLESAAPAPAALSDAAKLKAIGLASDNPDHRAAAERIRI